MWKGCSAGECERDWSAGECVEGIGLQVRLWKGLVCRWVWKGLVWRGLISDFGGRMRILDDV